MEALRFEVLDANKLTLQVGEKWKTAMRLAFLDFTVETSPEPVLVKADINGLQRLLTILLDNAVRYTLPGGSVYLRVAPAGRPGGIRRARYGDWRCAGTPAQNL